jgi:hypothetical protein
LRPGPTIRAALVLAAFLAVFLAVDRIAAPGGRPAARSAATRASAGSAPPSSRAAAVTTSTAAPATGAPTTTVPGTTVGTLRPVTGVTVQVLNGVFVTGLAHRVAARLRSAGYEVVAANTALGTYRVSRIYYTDGHRADAVALRARFPAFQQIAPAPANLSRRIALHVVIGQNYR